MIGRPVVPDAECEPEGASIFGTPSSRIASILDEYKARFLWHFTDSENLSSIREHGLLAWRQLSSRGLCVPRPGGNTWSHDRDEWIGLDDYVHLCFVRSHPMKVVATRERRLRSPVWLPIDMSVLELSGVLFTNDVANKRDVRLLTADQAAAAIDFEILYSRRSWFEGADWPRRQAAEKSEILVPRHIPIEFIMEPEIG